MDGVGFQALVEFIGLDIDTVFQDFLPENEHLGDFI
jgi:hypothetical protein